MELGMLRKIYIFDWNDIIRVRHVETLAIIVTEKVALNGQKTGHWNGSMRNEVRLLEEMNLQIQK